MKTKDWKAALLEFPDHLGFEKSVLNHLINKPTDYIGSLRRLPKKLRWMFVHAYQGYIFNLALSEYIKKGKVPKELPLIGCESKPDKVSKKILEKEGITLEEFNVSAMPEMSTEGQMRKSLISFSDFDIVSFNQEDSKIVVRFSLPPGAYATVLLRELMK
jgi:tRNA pseudouridine13 synthase